MIRKLPLLMLCLLAAISAGAQPFEGVLKFDFVEASGKKNAADVYVKGHKFYIRKVYGGCDRYEAYLYDTELHTLYCLSSQSPKVAMRLNIDQILQLYEDKQLKPGYAIHPGHCFEPVGSEKEVSGCKSRQMKTNEGSNSYEIWVAGMQANFSDLLPVMRVAGFWNDTEAGDSLIVESLVTDLKTRKVAYASITPIKLNVQDKYFILSPQYDPVDMDKFLQNEYKSPRFAELVKAFAGF